MYIRYFKRLLDVLITLMGLFVLLPLLFLIAVLVRIKLGSPIIYKTNRIGKGEKQFTLYKFRTMTYERDENGVLLADEKRITRFGKTLRSTSLDELPELFNVLLGDMSLIGPRPLPKIYLPYYTQEERIRHTVRPGLTGLAQINGRNAIGWYEKFKFDIKYVNEVSLIVDVKIFLNSIIKVIKRSDIGVPGQDAPESLHICRSQTNN